MKMLMSFLTFLLFSSFFCGEACYALDTPYVVIAQDVWLFSEQGEKVFLLPESYYAPIVGMDENYYFVQFNGVKGKLPKNTVSVTGYGEEVAGTTQTLHISEKYSAFVGLKLQASMEGQTEGDDAFIPVGEPFTYLGSYPTADKTWYYVCYGDKYGYVLSDFCDTEVKTRPFEPEIKTEEEEKEGTPEEKKDDSLLKILVVSGVAVTVVILLLVLVLPGKKKKTRYYYES